MQTRIYALIAGVVVIANIGFVVPDLMDRLAAKAPVGAPLLSVATSFTAAFLIGRAFANGRLSRHNSQ